MTLDCPVSGCPQRCRDSELLIQHWVQLHQYPTAEAYERTAELMHLYKTRSVIASEMVRTSARRTVFWRDILRAVAPDTVKILLRSERATRRRLKNRETP